MGALNRSAIGASMTAALSEVSAGRPASPLVQLRLAIAGVAGAVSGVAPHVLHHVGPIAGAAIVSGATGTIVFGTLGSLLMIPSLLRIKRHFGTWVAPGIALTVFAILFTISTVWIGPTIRGEPSRAADVHSPEHETHSTATATPGGR